MKKAKSMVLIVAAISVVGAALAYNATKKVNRIFCTTNNEDHSKEIGQCECYLNGQTTDDPGPQFYYTPVQNCDDCNFVSCPSFKTIIAD